MSTLALSNIRISTAQLRGMAMPIVIVLILAMMLLPLPAFLLDLLFTFNIAISLMVLLVSVYTKRPLDFAVFPTVLLISTLMRLSLNVASTRVVLINGHNGTSSAGKVIEAFGEFLTSGNFAVGLVVFFVLVVINFVVITKGAGRIAEVAARFTLDAMPGKQMAIDADLSAGLIAEAEAKQRRSDVSREADFYGAMDGASKFVRGDAIAGIMILAINIVGGLIIGMVQHDMSFAQSGHNYILLAIGDGLVAQVPALLISIAAGLIVSRVGDGEDMGNEIGRQLFAAPQAMAISAAILGLLGIVPGMPHFSFLLLAAIGGALAFHTTKRLRQAAADAAMPVTAPGGAALQNANGGDQHDASWEDVIQVDTVGLEVGYRLIPLVDKSQDGELLKRIKAIRKKFAQDIGFLPTAVHIRDNLEIRPSAYRLLLKGAVIGEGEIQPTMWLAINPGKVMSQVQGIPTRDPAFGLPALWIDVAVKEQAQAAGYTVVDSSTVVATHLSHLIHTHAGDLLGRSELQALIEHFGRLYPKLIDDLTPKLLPLSGLLRVLQLLLEEGVTIRDFKTIIESLSEHAGRTQDPIELAAQVRIALGRSIVQNIFGPVGELEFLAFEPELERILLASVGKPTPDSLVIEPGLAESLLNELAARVDDLDATGQPAALLVPDRLRFSLARLVRRNLPKLNVLAHAEIPGSRIVRVIATVSGRGL